MLQRPSRGGGGRALLARVAAVALATGTAARPLNPAAPAADPAQERSPPAEGLSRPEDRPAPGEPAPLFSFAWVSDLHLDPGRIDLARAAFGHIDRELSPDFVLFTGDDNAIPAPPEDPSRPEPVDFRRQRFLAAFLREHLRAPAVLIPGDNWPGGFEEVFGSAQRSFDRGGLHFLLLSPDRSCRRPGAEGLSVFDPDTWAWILKDLEANRGKPTIVAVHEPVHPPSFLDAPRLKKLLAGHPQVVAVLQGHLHLGLHFSADGKAYVTAPALGPARTPAFKEVAVFEDRLVLRTWARDAASGAFVRAGGERRVEFPRDLRGAPRRPEDPFAMEDEDSVPPHPLVEDPGLAARAGELLRNLGAFLEASGRPAEEGPAGARPRSEEGKTGNSGQTQD